MLTKRIRVYGIVQGVGFRPTVARHALECQVKGTVCNFGPYVEILVQGFRDDIDAFLKLLKEEPPKRASIIKMDVDEIYDEKRYDAFEIIESSKTKGDIFISPDIAICDECTREIFDKKDRRYLHPFINCTCCGPRLTILDNLPYDRERTSMSEFPMCDKCAEEYNSPLSRRYDAQPVCCNECGPEVYILGGTMGIKDGAGEVTLGIEGSDIRGRDAITLARKTVIDGGVIAIKGIGGFHLCCDATNDEAVKRLRVLKNRPGKPFAVMMKNMETLERECIVPDKTREIITGHQKPILLLTRKEGGLLPESIAPKNPTVGVMLPYAPVQLLLFDYDDGLIMPDCLVMTSGNISGAPIARTDEDVVSQISSYCDVVLSHNRQIRTRADDSVMDWYEDEPYMIRRSRGYAPLPVMVDGVMGKRVLAMGGELKNTFCVGSGDLFYPSSYIGDLADLRSVEALKETVDRFLKMLEIKPDVIVCDKHPKYNSTLVAEELSAKMNVPLIQVQHHYAHILSVMAENNILDRCIGLSFDGTGYGDDGTIWGGEILLSDIDGYERAGCIEPFIQAGGDLSSKEGWRIAVSLLGDIYGDEALSVITSLGVANEVQARAVLKMVELKANSVVSTSMGRLFDGVSALLGIRLKSTFEGEAATILQFKAEKSVDYDKYDLEHFAPYRLEDGKVILNTREMVKFIADRRLQGDSAEDLAMYFHMELAHMAVEACKYLEIMTKVKKVALSGGCFQNKLLLGLTEKGLKDEGFTVYKHKLIPPNDGGLCLGQAVYGAGLA